MSGGFRRKSRSGSASLRRSSGGALGSSSSWARQSQSHPSNESGVVQDSSASTLPKSVLYEPELSGVSQSAANDKWEKEFDVTEDIVSNLNAVDVKNIDPGVNAEQDVGGAVDPGDGKVEVHHSTAPATTAAPITTTNSYLASPETSVADDVSQSSSIPSQNEQQKQPEEQEEQKRYQQQNEPEILLPTLTLPQSLSRIIRGIRRSLLRSAWSLWNPVPTQSERIQKIQHSVRKISRSHSHHQPSSPAVFQLPLPPPQAQQRVYNSIGDREDAELFPPEIFTQTQLQMHTLKTFSNTLNTAATSATATTNPIRNAHACFKSERESFISDLTTLWRRIEVLETESHDLRTKLEKQNSLHAKVLTKKDQQIAELKKMDADNKKQLMCRDNEVKDLARLVAFSKDENRRLQHLVTAKDIQTTNIKISHDNDVTRKLTLLNSRANSSDARGDGLASDIIELRRAKARREGSLKNELEETRSIIKRLEHEVRVKDGRMDR